MTTMTHPIATFAEARHHPITMAMLVLLFWSVAAVLAATCHIEIDRRSPAVGSVATGAAIVGVAYAYMRICARHAGVSHALGVGMVWLVLAIVAEVIVGSRIGHGWYSLIGTPDRPLLRNLFLFVWIFAPALFAQREIAE